MIRRRPREKLRSEVIVVTCATDRHRVRIVDDDTLELLDHNTDHEALRTLVALGGDPGSGCEAIADAWTRARVDLLPPPLAEQALRRWAAVGLEPEAVWTFLSVLVGGPLMARGLHPERWTAVIKMAQLLEANLGRVPVPADVARVDFH